MKENSDKNNTQEIERLEREVITELTKKIEELESQILSLKNNYDKNNTQVIERLEREVTVIETIITNKTKEKINRRNKIS